MSQDQRVFEWPDASDHGPADLDLTGLVKKAKTGSQWAFARLVDLLYQDVFRAVYYRTRSRMDAEDLTQEVFLKAFQGLPSLRETSQFRAWLFAIALNRIRDHQRKDRLWALLGMHTQRQEREMDELQDTGGRGLEPWFREAFWRELGDFLDGLPRLQREVFLLRFMDELSLGEISKVMGKEESTIKTHLYRAVKRFRDESGDLRTSLKEISASCPNTSL